MTGPWPDPITAPIPVFDWDTPYVQLHTTPPMVEVSNPQPVYARVAGSTAAWGPPIGVASVNVGFAPASSVTKVRRRTSHGLHLVLTILTGGVWGLFVWLPLTLWHRYGPRAREVTTWR